MGNIYNYSDNSYSKLELQSNIDNNNNYSNMCDSDNILELSSHNIYNYSE